MDSASGGSGGGEDGAAEPSITALRGVDGAADEAASSGPRRGPCRGDAAPGAVGSTEGAHRRQDSALVEPSRAAAASGARRPPHGDDGAGRSLRAVVVGRGRMGAAIAEELERRGHRVVAMLGRDEDLTIAAGADVAFEFTAPASAARHVERLIGLGVPTVCGTTGWSAESARAAANERLVPLLVESNFSLAVAVLRRVVRDAAARLLALPEYEAGIVERHHNRKRDAPSGTALALAAAAEQASGRAVPVVALRLSGQPGEHQVVFEGPDESLEFTHRARSRRLFAAGAVRAAEWLLQRRPQGAVRLDDLLEERT